MKLKQLEGKRIKLIDVDGKTFEGVVGEYIYPEDNEPEGVEGIIIDNSKYDTPIQFNEPEIGAIKII